jgi:acyl-CoA synthetase (NDP forming)
VRAVVEGALERGGGWLSPVEINTLFDAVGIAVAKTRYAPDRDSAAGAAADIGFPVALKAAGPAILHKTEVGGVLLGLADRESVREAYADLAARLGDRLTGVIVQEMVAGGVEMVVGATLDPTFGPLVLLGSGGVFVELLRDVAFRMNPLTDQDVEEMMSEVKGMSLLRGYRGAPPADEAALRDLVLRVSALLDLCPQIRELDANPVKVLRKGAIVVDARVRVERFAPPSPTRRIAY